MNYEFIKQRVEEIVGEKAEYVKIPKGKHLLNAIVIGNGNVRPQFYVDDFTKDYASEEEIAHAIADCYRRTETNPFSKLPDFTNFASVKDMIFPCLVNNGAFIDDKVVLKKFVDDIDISYRMIIDENSSSLIKKGMLEMWNISVEELHTLATNNLDKKEYYFDDMIKTIVEMADFDEETKKQVMKEQSGFMYLLSNKNKLYGASNLLNEKTLKTVQEKIGDYFIIPSSIHELILLPYNEFADVSQISRMVREVNDTQVSEDERLSYSVFCYKAESGLSQVA